MQFRSGRWLTAAAVALLLPKCLLCIAGYAAVLLGIQRVGVELCGDLPGAAPSHLAWLAGSAAAIALVVAGAVRKFLRPRS